MLKYSDVEYPNKNMICSTYVEMLTSGYLENMKISNSDI